MKVNKKTILVAAVTLLLAAALFVGAAGATGDGSQDNPFDAADWNSLTDLSALSGTIYIADTNSEAIISTKESVSLTSDLTLDFSGYKGTFENIAAKFGNNGALFGSVTIEEGATLEIRNLTMSGVTVYSQGDDEENGDCENLGGIIGKADGAGNLIISGCHLTNCYVCPSDDDGSYCSYAGGLVSSTDLEMVTISGCSIEGGKIKGECAGGMVYSANSVSFADCHVKNCEISGDSEYIGGLFGGHERAEVVEVKNCSIEESTVSCDKVGGLVGDANSVSFEACHVKNCEISGGECAGGLFGGHEEAEEVKVKSCSIEESTVSDYNRVGGMVSCANFVSFDECHVVNCSVDGGENTGGLFGGYDDAEVEVINCSIEGGTVSNRGSDGTGGMVGRVNSVKFEKCKVVNCSVLGSQCGGLAGYPKSVNITDCDVENCEISCGNGNSSGGLVGYIEEESETCITACNVKNCVVYAKDYSSTTVGGMVGSADCPVRFKECNVENCSVSGTYAVGGLVGSGSVDMSDCHVINCIVSAGTTSDVHTATVGGMLGSGGSISSVGQVCSVEKCTIACHLLSWNEDMDYVGGLIGKIEWGNVNFTAEILLKESAVTYASGPDNHAGKVIGWYGSNEEGTPVAQSYDAYDTVSVDETVVMCSSLDTITDGVVIAKSTGKTGKQGPETESIFDTQRMSPVEITEDDEPISPPYGANITKVYTRLIGYGCNNEYKAFVYLCTPKRQINRYPGSKYGDIEYYPSSLENEGTLVTITATPHTGYHLEELYYRYYKGWALGPTLVDGKIYYISSGIPFEMPASDIVITDVYEPNTTTVTLDKNGGTGGTTEITATYDAAMPESGVEMPSKIGYTFAGYFDAQSGGKMYYSGNGTSVGTWDKDVETATLYAQWTANKYTVTFNNNGGNTEASPKTIEETYDGNYVLPTTDPVKTGYDFAGWYTDATGGTQVTTSTKVTTTVAQTLYAHWTASKYTVTFNNNGGNTEASPKTIEETYDSNYILPSTNPSRTGHTFAGWWTETNGGTQVTTSTVVNTAGAHFLYAHWTVNQYTITFDSNGGSSVAPITQDYDTAVTPPVNPIKKGYTFKEWSPAVPSTMPAAGVICTALWTPKQEEIPTTNEHATIEIALVAEHSENLVKISSADNVSGSITINPAASVEKPAAAAAGYSLEKTYAVYQMSATAADSSKPVTIIIQIKLSTNEKPENVYLRHYTEHAGKWDTAHIKSESYSSENEWYKFIFPATQFSPFAVVYETPVKQSSSSPTGGSSTWLTEIPTATPTVQPTAELTPSVQPSVVPIENTPAPATHAPFIGILAGLGAAAALFGLRRK